MCMWDKSFALILKNPSWMILKIELCKAINSKEQPSSHVNQWNFELEASVCAGLHMIAGFDSSKFIEVSCLLAYSINRFFFLRGKNPEGEYICNIHLLLTAAPCWKEKITIFGLELGFFFYLSGVFFKEERLVVVLLFSPVPFLKGSSTGCNFIGFWYSRRAWSGSSVLCIPFSTGCQE